MKATIIAVVVALAAVSGFILLSGEGPTDDTGAETQSEGLTEEEELQTYTFEQVALHNSADDCWMIIEASVYDVTEFIPLHEGGDEILRGCGRDATELFNTRTTENGEPIGSGEPHSSRARSLLNQFKIGELATDL